jgi:hypothetical protein
MQSDKSNIAIRASPLFNPSCDGILLSINPSIIRCAAILCKHSATGAFLNAKRLRALPIKPEDGQPWSGGMAMKVRRLGEDDP